MLISGVLRGHTEQRRDKKEGAVSLLSLSDSAKYYMILSCWEEYRLSQGVPQILSGDTDRITARTTSPNPARLSCPKRKRKTIHARGLDNEPNFDRETLIYEKRAYRQFHSGDGGTETSDGENTGSFWLPMMPHVQTAFSRGFSIRSIDARSLLRVGSAFLHARLTSALSRLNFLGCCSSQHPRPNVYRRPRTSRP